MVSDFKILKFWFLSFCFRSVMMRLSLAIVCQEETFQILPAPVKNKKPLTELQLSVKDE